MKRKTVVKYLILIIVIFTILIAQNSCKDSPVAPNNNLQPGRRDYTWTVDTLFIPFTYLERIWGSSPNDVWAIGSGDADKTIYHYDGNKWSNDGKSRGINPFALWGFGPDDVWIGGYGPLYHYDGKDWNRDFEYVNPDFIHLGIQDIWGDSPDNVWAIGFADSSDVRIGVIFHYNGNSWNRVNIGFTRTTMMRIKRGEKTSDNYFIWGIRENNEGDDTTKILEFDGRKLKELHSSIFDRYHLNFVQLIDKEVIFLIDNGLFYYNYGKFKKIIENDSIKILDNITGTNIKNIFWSMRDGITHYNGLNIKYVLNFSDEIRIRESIAFDKEVFFLANNFNNSLSIIYHGILK